MYGDDLKHLRRRSRTAGKAHLNGILVRSAMFVAMVVICVLAIRFVRDRASSRDQSWRQRVSESVSTPYTFRFQRRAGSPSRSRRLVYPYSVVPGGVISGQELREAASHDPVVAKHYADFDYRRARIIELKEPKRVYLSYRLGNRVFWTRQQALLRVGEKLLTDGSTTARTRCGNQVSVAPHADVSPGEPAMSEFEQPDALASGNWVPGPANLSSNLLQMDPAMPIGPGSPRAMAGPLTGGSGGVVPPVGGGGFGGGTGGSGPPGGGEGGGGPPPPPVTPEPGTIVLVASGAGLIFARYRKR